MILHPVLKSVVLLCGGLSSVCWAQFAGDVFFKNPSIAAEAGGTAEFEVQAFTGSRPLGAAHLDFIYDPSLLEVVAVKAGDAVEFVDDGLMSKRRSAAGLTSFVALNSVSLNNPFGTVSFAKITVRPLASAGQTIPVSLRVNGMLDTGSMAYASTSGFNGEVVVTSPVTSPSSVSSNNAALRIFDGVSSSSENTADEVLGRKHRERAALMGRPGQRVLLMDLEWSNNEFLVVPREVVIDPIEGSPEQVLEDPR